MRGQSDDVVDRFHQCHSALRQLPQRSHDFGVTGMANEDDVPTGFARTLRLLMHLGHQGTGCVDIFKSACFRLGRNSLGHAVGAENDRDAVGHLIERFDENRALGAQRVDDIAVVDDFVPDIDRCPETLDCKLHDTDRPVDARTKAARCRNQQLQFGRRAAVGMYRRQGSVHDAGALAQHGISGKAASHRCAAFIPPIRSGAHEAVSTDPLRSRLFGKPDYHDVHFDCLP